MNSWQEAKFLFKCGLKLCRTKTTQAHLIIRFGRFWGCQKAASHPVHPAGPLTGCDVLCPPIGLCINCSVETLSYRLLSFSVGGWWCGEGDMLRFELIIVSVTLGQKHWEKPTKITLAICCWMSSFPQRGTQVCPPMGRNALWVSLSQQQTLFKSNYLSGSNFLIDKWWGWTRWFQKNFRTVGLAD